MSESFSLDDVVAAMSKETGNSTLGWDVVVNYGAKEMNDLLKEAYDKNHEGQLMDLSFQYKGDNEDGTQYNIDVVLKFGAPLIQFVSSAMVPLCSLDIPIIGGSVKTSKMEKAINPDVYSVHLSGILLSCVNGTKDNRKLTPSHEPFLFDSPDTTGAVTLDLETSSSKDLLKATVLKTKDDISYIDNKIEDLGGKIRNFFETSPNKIHWDLAQVNNSRPSTSGAMLVPKSFQFAVYSPTKSDSKYTILSLFIETEGGKIGTVDSLQSNWSAQWSKSEKGYGIPPIPQSYTASVIFNNKWIKDLVEKSVTSQGLTITNIPKTSSDTWALKWKILTGKKFVIERTRETHDKTTDMIERAEVDLDKEATGLHMTIGQNGDSSAQANALLEWEFSFVVEWGINVIGYPHAGGWGKVKITDKLNTKKYVDNSVLPNYQVHLDASLKKDDWDPPKSEAVTEDERWYEVGRRSWNPSFAKAQPELPTFQFKFLDLDFFLTTNLLLPNQNVIKFETTPGVRFPRDLYIVGQVVKPASAS